MARASSPSLGKVTWTQRLLLVFFSSLAVLVCGEVAVRLKQHIPLTETDNLLRKRFAKQQARVDVEYHPLLGWVHRQNSGNLDGFGTGPYGIRLNGHPLQELPANAIMAVGDSFTAGVDVANAATWPAHLERILGQTVLNAGVGGWATDQIVLRAESLLPILKPRAIILSFYHDDIERAEFSSFSGRAKPYFIVENGQLHLMNYPVPDVRRATLELGFWRSVLGRFTLVNFIMERLHPAWGLNSWDSSLHARAHKDGLAVSQLLLSRLKEKTDAAHARLILMMEYSAEHVEENAREPEVGQSIRRHAQALGIETVDTWGALRAVLAKRGAGALHELYLPRPGGQGFGHMSSAGNEFLARLLAGLFPPEQAGSNRPPG